MLQKYAFGQKNSNFMHKVIGNFSKMALLKPLVFLPSKSIDKQCVMHAAIKLSDSHLSIYVVGSVAS